MPKTKIKGVLIMGELVHVGKLQQNKQLNDLLEKVNVIPKRYEGDIRRFEDYCDKTFQSPSCDTLLNYLSVSVDVHKVKKTTWERRLAAIKKYLQVEHGQTLNTEQKAVLSKIRKVYSLEEYAEQTHIQGQPALDKKEIMDMIQNLDRRKKAICMVNLITANRPNEMVRMKISDFDFQTRSVRVYLKKQKEWHNKRLTQEVIKAVRDYIRAYGLKKDDYFVGRCRKNGHYESVQIGEVAYNKSIHRWLGFAPYSLRKTQVSSMHEKGADLPSIAKQTGHKSLETLSKHYLKVSDSTVDKYL